MNDEHLPLETINATLEVHAEVNEWADQMGIYDLPRAEIHDLVDKAVWNAHLLALALAGTRVLTISEIAGRLGISEPTVRRRLRDASPPILPVKTIGDMKLYVIEDLPAIATAHLKNVIEEGKTTRYVAAKIRKTIAQVHNKGSIRRLVKEPTIRFPDIDARPITVSIKVDPIDHRNTSYWAKLDGWKDIEHLLLGVIVSYSEISRRWKEKE